MFSYRSAELRDFSEIAKFPQNEEELFFMYPKGTYPITPQQLEIVARTRIMPTVVLHENEVVGYCNIYKVTEESSWLGNVIIKPSYRGSGVGKFLIETMKERAKAELKVKYLRLVCHNINTNALLFYTKLGFRPFAMDILIDNKGNEIVGINMEIKV